MGQIAYLFSEFPTLSTTFLQREVKQLLDLGVHALLISNRSPSRGAYHPQDGDLLKKTFYLTPFNALIYLIANLKCLVDSPKRYLRTIKLALTLKDGFSWQRLRNISHMAGAAVLADYLKGKDVVHVHVHFAFGAASVAIFLESLTDIPYSLSIHGSDVLLPRPLTGEKLKRAKFVISNCQYHIKNLKARFPRLRDQRFHIVRIGLSLNRGPWSKLKRPEADSTLRILNVGRLVPIKAQDNLIRACAMLRDRGIGFHCRIVGEGTKESELQDLIESLGLRHCVELMGGCYEPQVVALYEWAHVIVLSSLSEGTPMVIIEAMAKARPVIGPRITALPELVLENRTGYLFEPGSLEDLADKMAAFSFHSELIGPMGFEGRKLAEKYFDIGLNTKKLVDIFSDEIVSFRSMSRE